MSKSFLNIALYVALIAASCVAEPNVFPITSGGECFKGQSFVINSIQDLKTNINDLECIFSAGVAPDQVGLGFYYGTVLLHENSMGMAALAAPFYQGDYVVKTTCNQETLFLGTVKVGGFSVGTAPWAIAAFAEPTDPLDAPIDPLKNNILVDYRQNVQQMCPIEDQAALLNAKGFFPYRYSPVPMNCYVDIARVVGRDVLDGGLILLSKGLNRDMATGWKTSLFHGVKTFDPVVKPDFKSGTEIVNKVAFTYTHRGFVDTVTHFGGQGLNTALSNFKEEAALALVSNPLVAAITMLEGEVNNGATTVNLDSSSSSVDSSFLSFLSGLGFGLGLVAPGGAAGAAGLPIGVGGLPIGAGSLFGGLPVGAGSLFGGLPVGAGKFSLLEGTAAAKLLEEVQKLRGAARTASFGESTVKRKN